MNFELKNNKNNKEHNVFENILNVHFHKKQVRTLESPIFNTTNCFQHFHILMGGFGGFQGIRQIYSGGQNICNQIGYNENH